MIEPKLLQDPPKIACEDITTASFYRTFLVQLKIYYWLNLLEEQRVCDRSVTTKIEKELFAFLEKYENESSLDYDLHYVRQYVKNRYHFEKE